MRPPPMIGTSALSHLDCARCGRRVSADQLVNLCDACGGPLLARYELSRQDLRGLPWDLALRPADLWRFAELLPVRSQRFRVGLGEGMTPILSLPRLAGELGLEQLWLKDEGRCPTGSFKARGMAVAVARAAELGARALAAPSAGNAGLALSAYAARHGLRALVAYPEDIPQAYVQESRSYGAEVLVAGATIREAGMALRRRIEEDAPWREAFDLSTLREPYRLEGKKTMGYEIAEQLREGRPDAILYPTGGGTGLIGIVKAFDEMASLGWIPEGAPRMIAVQMSGCCPIVEGVRKRSLRAVPPEFPHTRCWGLRVPAPFADREIFATIARTGGTAIAVEEEDLAPSRERAALLEGLDVAPEGAAALAAIPKLIESGAVQRSDRVLVLNTASSWMYG